MLKEFKKFAIKGNMIDLAVGMIIGYIICANLFLLLGKQGIFNPVFAGLAPTVCFIAYGYYKVLMGGGN